LNSQRFKTLVFAGLIAGCLFGLIQTWLLVDAQAYMSNGMWGLILSHLTARLNRGVGAGLVFAFSAILISLLLHLAWQKLFCPFFQIQVKKKINSRPLKKFFLFLFSLSLSVFLFVRYFQHKVSMPILITSQVFVLLVLTLSILPKRKSIQGQQQKPKKTLNIHTIRKVCLGCVIALLIINLGNILDSKLIKTQSPNILLVVADALRADHLGCYGYDLPTSPFIDRFAGSSVLFENHMSNASWTKPSMGTLLTSLYPHEHRAIYWTDNLQCSSLSMAELFLNRNYRTMAVQTNPSITSQHNFSQGFQVYTELPIDSGQKATEEFNAWLAKNHQKSFFVYVHFMDTHMPYNAPEEFSSVLGIEENGSSEPLDFKTMDIRILTELGLDAAKKESLLELYDRAVSDIDRHFENLIKSLSRFGVLDNTLIIFTSDHGEEFWEHGGFAHGHSLYNELIEVPLLIHFPPKLFPKRIPSYTQHLDLFPTILSLLNIRCPRHLRGRDLKPVLYNPNIKTDAVLFFEGILFGSEKRGVIKDGWKLIENTDRRHEAMFAPLGDLEKLRNTKTAEEFELYNLIQDYSETKNLASERPDTVSELKTHLLAKLSAGVRLLHQKQPDLEKKLEDLRALGYTK
jgi:arylsulfatase A-like enzyme